VLLTRRLSLLFGALALFLANQDAAARPNLILIMADDMGFECLSPYGSLSYETPAFDRFASRRAHLESQNLLRSLTAVINIAMSHSPKYQGVSSLLGR